MAQDRFMVGPYKTGLQTDVDPWLLPDDAYSDLRNAFLYEDRVRKRVGSKVINSTATDPQLNTRLRIMIGQTTAGGRVFNDGVTPGRIPLPGVKFEQGQAFSIGSVVFTVSSAAAGTQNMLRTVGVSLAQFNVTNGQYDILGALGLTDVYFYPATPVMGFATYEQAAVNNERSIAFDTQFAYQYINGEWSRIATGNDLWTGINSDFFWSVSARGTSINLNYLYTSNFTIADQIRYWDGATWSILLPQYGAVGGTDEVVTAKIIMFFKDRLILMNTIEITGTSTSFVNRIRYSQNGNPFQANAWRQDIPGRGNYLDAPTKESIVSAAFLKDRLIIYFERSTFELVYTGNSIFPFRFQKINTELGVESTFSKVEFDKGVLGVGATGIHECNGTNVIRRDQKIKDNAFDISNINGGLQRVHGIRDYWVEAVYWTYPSSQEQTGVWNNTFPNRMLVYDYTKQAWSYNDDSITAFGYLQNLTGLTWGAAKMLWGEADFIWGNPQTFDLFRDTVAGNQEGYTFLIDKGAPRNAPALQITDLTLNVGNTVTMTVLNHNLNNKSYIYIENAQGTTSINNRIYQVTPTDANTFVFPDDDETIVGTYTGGGTIALVTPLKIDTKDYNFYLKEGSDLALERVDFFVDRTAKGQVTVDYFLSTSLEEMVKDATLSNTILGTNILETTPYLTVPFEEKMKQFWHQLYFQANGQFVRLRIYLTHEQIIIPLPPAIPPAPAVREEPYPVHSEFVLSAVIYHVTATSSRLQ